mgnify:CR=1 FL=1
MINNFDPKQETLEEYLRRVHLDYKLDTEWKHEEEEKEKRNIFRTSKKD